RLPNRSISNEDREIIKAAMKYAQLI
ncbi:uncharacterized protein METZ01_LOCUS275823, partial [marine metagenome]